jgi:glycosyltransferase involved in cell wall biosynthesis
MKILIIRNYPNYMDVQFNTYNIQEIGLAKALVRKGHKCDIVFWADKEEKTIDYVFDSEKHITVFYRFGKSILKNAIYNNINDLICKYDVIQPCEYNQYQSWVLAKKYPKKTVIYHGPYFSDFNKRFNLMCKIFDVFFLKRYIKLGTKFMVKSNLACSFLNEKGILEKNISTVGVGLDLGALSTNEDDVVPAFISKIDRFKDDVKLLYIGRLEERRNIPYIYDVLKAVLDKGFSAKLIIVGKGDKEYTDRCNDYAEKIGVTERIYKTDKLEQKYMSKLYEKSDFFLLPTHYEIFGMVLLEAMYFKALVITTLNGGSDVLIENGKNGIVMDCDAEKCAEKIIRLFENKEIYNSICMEAYNHIKSNFIWDSLVSKFIKAYESLRQEDL